MRHEEQAATRSLQCRQEGWAGQAEVGTCSSQPSLAPIDDFTMLLLSLPQDFINTPPPRALPPSSAPRGLYRIWEEEEPGREGEDTLPLQR